MLAVYKPAGIPVIPGRLRSSGPSVKLELEKALGHRLFVVHRLDRDTTGVLLFGLTAESHRQLSMAFEAGRIQKHYLALVEGQIHSPHDISLALVPARRNRMRVARADEVGKAARTRIVPREVFSAASLVEAVPLTGRTHQIRVHLQAIGHPLCVDAQYRRPTRQWNLERTPLHAWKIRIPGSDRFRLNQIGSTVGAAAGPRLDRTEPPAAFRLQDPPSWAPHSVPSTDLRVEAVEENENGIEIEAPLPPDMETALKRLRG